MHLNNNVTFVPTDYHKDSLIGLGDEDEVPCKRKILNFLPGLKTFAIVIFDKRDLKKNVLRGSCKVYKARQW